MQDSQSTGGWGRAVELWRHCVAELPIAKALGSGFHATKQRIFASNPYANRSTSDIPHLETKV